MFEGESLARTYSQEHLERQRSASLSSRRSGQGFAPAGRAISRGVPTETVPEHEDEHHDSEQSNTPTLAEPDADVEANRGEKQGEKATGGGHSAGHEDPYFVGLKGREHISPHSWYVFKPESGATRVRWLSSADLPDSCAHRSVISRSVPYRWFLTGFGGLLVLNASECFVH